MKHYCGGQILYNKDEDIWYCSRCNKIHLSITDFETDNKAEEHYREQEQLNEFEEEIK